MMVGNVRELHESAFLDIWTMHQVKLDTLVCEIKFMNYINAITGALSLTVCEAPIDDCYHKTSKILNQQVAKGSLVRPIPSGTRQLS